MRIQNKVKSQRIIIKSHTGKCQTFMVVISYCVYNPQEVTQKIQNPFYSSLKNANSFKRCYGIHQTVSNITCSSNKIKQLEM